MNSRVCSKCKIEKNIEEFRKDSQKPLGRMYVCSICHSKASSNWYLKNKKKVLEYQKRYREENIYSVKKTHKAYREANRDRLNAHHRQYQKNLSPERKLLASARDRAAKYNREFNITIDHIVIPDKCPILHIPLFSSKGRATANSPSLDRIDNSKGYIPGNIRVISFKANALKSDFTSDDLKNILRYMGEL